MLLKQILTISTLVTGLTFSGNWKPDAAKAKISFSVKGPFGTVNGNFSGLQATIVFDEKDPSKATISASVDPKTVSTGVSLRNSDLRKKEEWFNADKYPRISFKSKKIEKSDKDYKLLGDLTIKNVTKPVEIPFSFIGKAGTGTFKGHFTIQRSDYGLGKPGGSVGSTITIDLTIPVKTG
jgi:polyisoprenoid-binding protein YceI